MKLLTITFLIYSLFTVNIAVAGSEAASVDKLTKALAASMPNVKPSKISETAIEGLYEVIVGTQVVYMSDDARYMIAGDLIDIKTNKNISEKAKSGIRLAAVDKLGESNMLIYSPKKAKNTITVITDIDCPYCRRLHAEVPDYIENDVEVRYIFMPLKGSADMKKTVSVWCSDDQKLSLDIAKSGGDIEEKSCKNPIKKHMKLARELGVRGTPAILLEDGQLLPGYLPFDKVIAQMRQ